MVIKFIEIYVTITDFHTQLLVQTIINLHKIYYKVVTFPLTVINLLVAMIITKIEIGSQAV